MSIKEFLLSNKKRTGLLISVIIILSGVIPLIVFTFFADPAHPYTITETTLITEDYTKIQADIYTPANMSGMHPGVVIGHGFTGNSKHMQLLAIELVKREFVVVNINFRGHGSSGGYLPSLINPLQVHILEQDMVAGIRYLQALGNINKIGLVGHSMGSMTALRTADDHTNEINATVALGMVVGFEAGLMNLIEGTNATGTEEYNLTRIRNLLIANGRYEQMFTPSVTLDFLKLYTNRSDVHLEQLYGDFTNGTAAKAVTGETEHLFEPHDPHIMYETAAWFELTFYGTLRWPISITAPYASLSFAIALMGMIALCFVAIFYLHNYLWRDKEINLRKDLVQNTSTLKLVIYYIAATGIGILLLIPLSILFADVLPISMGQLLYAIPVGNAIGILLMYYLIIRNKEKLGFRAIPSKIKMMCSGNPWRAILYGILSAVLLALGITAIADWSTLITLPTPREIGTIFGTAILLFPWLLIKEFYFRTVQGQLKFSNRFKEYFVMVGLGFIMDAFLFIPPMILCWGQGSVFGFLALILTVEVIYSVIQQILVTWVYMYSGRNILGSTVFLCIFSAWMMVNFYPFGVAMF
jgi:pimeloyl-ACP methyl ester carboxylesterase